jgi:hypothetical protein
MLKSNSIGGEISVPIKHCKERGVLNIFRRALLSLLAMTCSFANYFSIKLANNTLVLPEYYSSNTYNLLNRGENMPKISLDMPSQLTEDLRKHVGDDKKFVSLADAVRTACRKLLDQLDEIDSRHGRTTQKE